jgi:hypothetical protein
MKIGYRQELQDRFTRQYPEMEISEQQIADQFRAIVTKGLLSRPWLEEIRAQVAETFKETNVNTEKEITQYTDNKKESRSLECPQKVENPELDKIKIEFYKALKEFEETNPTKYTMSDTQTKLFQEASYYYNHCKPGDPSGIFET